VVTNALRLNLFPIYRADRDKPIKHSLRQENKDEERKEKKTMEKTVTIEGMMCPHCSGRVQKALEEMPEVASAVVSHETGTAVVTLASEVADDVLVKTVTDAGYTVTGIH
jgi:Cu2+-exporting ATPase